MYESLMYKQPINFIDTISQSQLVASVPDIMSPYVISIYTCQKQLQVTEHNVYVSKSLLLLISLNGSLKYFDLAEENQTKGNAGRESCISP